MATDQTQIAPDPGVPPSDTRPTIGELVATLSEQLSALIRGEIELTKSKATAFLKKIGTGAALLVVAVIVGLYMVGWLFHTIEVALAVALPAWAASLIVWALLLIIVVVLALVGVKQIQNGQHDTPKPQEGLKEDVDAIKKGLSK